jgi:hypothetical protein
MSLTILDGAGATKYLVASGAGSEADPYLIRHEMIAFGHQLVHAGRLFYASHIYASVANDAAAELALVTDTAQPHLFARFAHAGDHDVYLFEGATVSGGTLVASINRNRTSVTSPGALVTHSPTVSADGTELYEEFVAGGKWGQSAGGAIRTESEWVLAPATTYVFRIINRSGTTARASISCEWYEVEV